MLKFATENDRARSNAAGGSFCAGSAPSTTDGCALADTEYLPKSKYTPPVNGAESFWNVCTSVSCAVELPTLMPSSVMSIFAALLSSGCASRKVRCAYGFAREPGTEVGVTTLNSVSWVLAKRCVGETTMLPMGTLAC